MGVYGYTGTGVTEKTAAQMKASGFVLTLGGSYVADTEGINGGYPLLAWQVRAVTFTRLAGEGRIATGVAIYDEGVRLVSSGVVTSGWSDTCIVTKAWNFADALSIAPWAFAAKAPVFLADSDSITDAVTAAIKAGGFKHVVVLGGQGGTDSVTDAMIATLGVDSVTRLAGSTRLETSKAVVLWETGQTTVGGDVDFVPGTADTLTLDGMAAASAWNYPDALASVGLLGQNHAALLLVDDSDASTACISQVVGGGKDGIKSAYILGGSSSVSAEAEARLNAALAS